MEPGYSKQGVGSHLSSQHCGNGGGRLGVQGQSWLHREVERGPPRPHRRLCSNKYLKKQEMGNFCPAHNEFWVKKNGKRGGKPQEPLGLGNRR